MKSAVEAVDVLLLVPPIIPVNPILTICGSYIHKRIAPCLLCNGVQFPRLRGNARNDEYGGKYCNKIVNASDVIRCKIEIQTKV